MTYIDPEVIRIGVTYKSEDIDYRDFSIVALFVAHRYALVLYLREMAFSELNGFLYLVLLDDANERVSED